MDTTAAVVCRAFAQRHTPEEAATLLEYLAEEERQQFLSLSPSQEDAATPFPSLDEGLKGIHFSWLDPFLRTLTETEIRLFLGGLEEEQVQGLKQRLLFSDTITPTPFWGKRFIHFTLFKQIAPADLLPLSCLPEHPLNCLLEFSEVQLLSLAHLLSMHDLSNEVRQVIDTVKLKKIHGVLSRAQQGYLKALSHKKEPIAFKKLGLASWDGNENALLTLLRQRGLNRIAKALFSAHPSLLWYISRRLDSQDGHVLEQLCTSLSHPDAAAILCTQVSDLATTLSTYLTEESL